MDLYDAMDVNPSELVDQVLLCRILISNLKVTMMTNSL